MRHQKAAIVPMGTWVAVEAVALWAAGFGVGPFVPMVCNEQGEVDGHTR